MSWIGDNVVEDFDICKSIAEQARKSLYDRFHIAFTDDETVLGFYGVVWNVIWDTIELERDSKKEFVVNIANFLELGFANNENDDTEKSGSFVPVIYSLDGKPEYSNDDYNMSTVEKCQSWNTSNIKTKKKFFDNVSQRASKQLASKVDIHLSEPEVILPCWTIIHETIIKFLPLKYSTEWYKEDDIETYEKTVNFCGCFNAILRNNKDGVATINIVPNVSSKVSIKDDSRAVIDD
jgi:hypothetical protein